jgi:hypothetical protein
MVLHNMLRGRWCSQLSANPSIANRYLRETSGWQPARCRYQRRSVLPGALAYSSGSGGCGFSPA